MPHVSIAVQSAAAPPEAWRFIANMDNWAPFLTGYQSHSQIDERRSVWTVKGELAGLTRIAEIDVEITAWEAPHRIAFELRGVDEPFTGFGEFRISATDAAEPPAARPGAIERVRDWIVSRLLSLLFGTRQKHERVASGAARSDLACDLTIEAGGGSGPIMNLLLAPMLPTIANDMSREIVSALERRRHDVDDAGAQHR